MIKIREFEVDYFSNDSSSVVEFQKAILELKPNQTIKYYFGGSATIEYLEEDFVKDIVGNEITILTKTEMAQRCLEWDAVEKVEIYANRTMLDSFELDLLIDVVKEWDDIEDNRDFIEKLEKMKSEL